MVVGDFDDGSGAGLGDIDCTHGGGSHFFFFLLFR